MRRDAWRRFRRNRLAIPGAIVFVLLWATVLIGPLCIVQRPNAIRAGAPLLGIGVSDHPLGTDDLGRDMLARMLYGGRISLVAGAVVVTVAVLIGVVAGTVAGYFGGAVDTVIMRAVDILLAFPFFILALGVVSALGYGFFNAMVTLAVVSWVGYARLLRGLVLAAKEREYVYAARALGANHGRIIMQHILPNTIQPTIVQASFGLATALLAASGLSFLGLGAQPPSPEWGALLRDGQAYLQDAPWLAFEPGLAVMLTALAVNFVGEGLRDAFDVRATR